MLSFLAAAALCAACLALYHTVAFGGPLETGYSFVTHPGFQSIYTPDNPTGLVLPTWERFWKILFSSHGLLWYAPILLLMPCGMLRMLQGRSWDPVLVTLVACGSFFLVNACHPTWTGGWSTGPRYLLPALPFAMLPVAFAVAGRGQWPRRILGFLGIVGFVVCLACAISPYGGRLPDYGIPGGDNPILQVALPDLIAGRLGRNLGNLMLYGDWQGPEEGNWLVLLPFFTLITALLVALHWRCCLRR